jgi:hypothetical protein
MKVKMIKFGVSVKIGRQEGEVTTVFSTDYDIKIEGMFVRVRQKFGKKNTALVCVTNIAYILTEDEDESTTTASVPVGSEAEKPATAKGRKTKSE